MWDGYLDQIGITKPRIDLLFINDLAQETPYQAGSAWRGFHRLETGAMLS